MVSVGCNIVLVADFDCLYKRVLFFVFLKKKL